MPGFGIHVCSWPEEAEDVAARRIKEASKKRLLGNIFPARESWYRRKCLSRVYFMSPLIIIVCLAMLKIKVIPTINMHAYVSHFLPTECVTKSANLTDVMLPCDCRASSKAPECKKEYPCFQLRVTIKTSKGLKVTTYLYEDMEALSLKYENCAVLNRRCKKTDPAHIVENLASHYSDPGSSFHCMFNPLEPHEVILHVAPLPISFWIMLTVVCVLMLVGVAAPIITYLTCGCMYVCSRSPPKDIQEEVDGGGRGGGGGEPEMLEEAEEEAPPAEPEAQQSEQPEEIQPMLQQQQQQQPQQPMPRPQSQPYLSPSQFLVPPPYLPIQFGGSADSVVPMYGAPIYGAPPRPVSQLYQPVQSTSPVQQPIILYVHPGGEVSLHPPPGTNPVTFNPNPPQSPSSAPSPSLMQYSSDEKDPSTPLFYQ